MFVKNTRNFKMNAQIIIVIQCMIRINVLFILNNNYHEKVYDRYSHLTHTRAIFKNSEYNV